MPSAFPPESSRNVALILKMPPTTSLDPISQLVEYEFKRAWDLFDAEVFEEANALATKLLLEPRLGHLHRAGCHLLLAHGPIDFV